MDPIIYAILIGLVAGFLAHLVVGGGANLVAYLVAGVLGGFLAGWLFPKIGLNLAITGNPTVNTIIQSTAGAIIVLLIARLVLK